MVKRTHRKKPSDQINIAKERIDNLFLQAEEIYGEDPALSDRYVELARTIAMKFKVRLTPHKKKFCKHCYKYLRQGVNCRVRTLNGKVVYSCFSCKKFMRFPYK